MQLKEMKVIVLGRSTLIKEIDRIEKSLGGKCQLRMGLL